MNNNDRPPGQWGVSDLDALKAWQGKPLEIHLITGKIIRGTLVGYSNFTLTLKIGEGVAVVNKGAITWYTEGRKG